MAEEPPDVPLEPLDRPRERLRDEWRGRVPVAFGPEPDEVAPVMPVPDVPMVSPDDPPVVPAPPAELVELCPMVDAP